MSLLAACDPQRVISDLRELERLTGGPDGSYRVAWSTGWTTARDWLKGKLSEVPCDVQLDPAGNLWAIPHGSPAEFVAVGSHLDSVPGGGWLDGALGVVAGLELIRASAGKATRAGIRLVDWADEEGARFGMSLFGSSAAAGTLDLAAASRLHDGVQSLEDAMRACGLDLDRAPLAQRSLRGARAYVELHIEQGPVLERTGRQVAVVSGTVGVDRRRLRIIGQAAHAGAAPMDMRHDPVRAAARLITQLTDRAVADGGTATVGRITASPGVSTIVPESCELTIDLRAADAAVLAARVAEREQAAKRIAAECGVELVWTPEWAIAPQPFDASLVELARACAVDCGHDGYTMPSGALHDAAAVASAAPTVMLFVPSIRGISHHFSEDTAEGDIAAGVRVLTALTSRLVE